MAKGKTTQTTHAKEKQPRRNAAEDTNSDRRQRVLGKGKQGKLWAGIAAFVILAGASGFVYVRYADQSTSGMISGTQVLEEVIYGSQPLNMTSLEASLEKGVLEIPLDVVKEKKLVYFEYRNQGKQLPLLAYITPGGKLVTAVSMCEPCRSTRFHIQGNHMVCNACFTRWDLESLQGISGGCLDYPPDVVAHSIEGNSIKINETDIVNWQPRA